MCEFISWIEKGNDIFYLTDKEIFSKQGQELLLGCKDNDFLGHGAIRKFYSLQYGREHEVKNF